MRSVLRSVVFLIIFSCSSAMANDNAGIFFYGTPPSPVEIVALANGAKVSTQSSDNMTTVVVEWPSVSVTVNINPNWNRSVQLSGIRGWLGQFPENERTSSAVVSFLGALDRTTTCYGSTISPAFDKEGKAAAFLRGLLGTSGGFFFSHQSFYSADGKRIAGLSGDPSILGPR
jgi:hypothetical protein